MPWEPLPSSSEREPEPVGRSLDRLVRHLGGPSAEVVSGLFARWPEVVGEQLAARTAPVAIRDGTLVLAVDDPAWAPQVRFLEGELLARARDVLGAPDLVRVQVKVGRVEGGGW